MYRQNCKVKQNPVCCVFCGKEYKQRRSLNTHMILCEDLMRIRQGKRPFSTQIDDSSSIPTNESLYLQIIKLTQKCARMEERLNLLETSANLEKPKINLIDWLMEHRRDNSYFDLVHEPFKSPSAEKIFTTPFVEVAEQILLDWVVEKQNEKNGTCLFACSEVKNKVYIHTKGQDWRLISQEDITGILNRIQMDCIKSLNFWKKVKSEASSLSDDLSSKYNKITLKLLNVNCKQESFARKIITQIYTQINQPIKS